MDFDQSQFASQQNQVLGPYYSNFSADHNNNNNNDFPFTIESFDGNNPYSCLNADTSLYGSLVNQANWAPQSFAQYGAPTTPSFTQPTGGTLDPALLAFDADAALPTGELVDHSMSNPFIGLENQPGPGEVNPAWFLQTEIRNSNPLNDASVNSCTPALNGCDAHPNIEGGKRKASSSASDTPSSKRRYFPERPRTVPGKPWIRTNNNTKGNSRTAKTNALDQLEYQAMTMHPAGWGPGQSWFGPQTNREFKYNAFGELEDECFTIEELRDFLYNHPLRIPGGSSHLILWVQKMPADSARRVECQYGNRCRFHDCPCNVYKQRTIGTGHYRVSIDEQWAAYGSTRNPMHVAMNVHLYCLERFLDFADICRNFDVRADCRDLPKEPHGVWGAALGKDTGESEAVEGLVRFARGRSTGLSDWYQYPNHADYQDPRQQTKPQDRTLAYKLCMAKAHSTGKSKLDMMYARGTNPKQYFVNKGDLKWCVDQQQAEAEAKRKRKAAEPVPEHRKHKSRSRIRELDSDSEADLDLDPDEEYRPHAARTSRADPAAVTRASTRVANQHLSSCRSYIRPHVELYERSLGGALTFADDEI